MTYHIICNMLSCTQCRAFYAGCDGNLFAVQTPGGSKQYDDWRI